MELLQAKKVAEKAKEMAKKAKAKAIELKNKGLEKAATTLPFIIIIPW